MGSKMAMLFAENGATVSIFDIQDATVNAALKACDDEPAVKGKVSGFVNDYKAFTSSLSPDSENLYVLSITHGRAGDEVIKGLRPYLKKGDIILDGGNEWYRNTERRQKELQDAGVSYIGSGVSGGYQSARRGPSMSPGGDKSAVDKVLPLMKKWAAKDKKTGEACVDYIGPGGSGHFVKMVHNGIEQGMLGVLNEAWEIMFKCMHTDLDDISQILASWNSQGELKNNFLVSIGADICSRHKEDGRGHILNEVQDKVVQDADDSEGTGVWTVVEAATRHVSAPTIAASHFLRIASADRAERLQVFDQVGGLAAAKKQHLSEEEKKAFLEDLRQAVYCAFVCSFIQGLNLVGRANKDEAWGVKLSTCIRIWREGCIIQSEALADILQPLFEKKEAAGESVTNLWLLPEVTAEVKRTYPSLRRVVMKALEWDAHVPTLSASTEYVKYCGAKQLPTQFMEAELDYFGSHNYDKKSEGPGEVKKGKNHYEWKPA